MRSIKLLKIPLLLFGLKVFAQEEHKPVPDRVLQRTMQMRDQLLTYTTPLNPKENEIIPYYIQSNGQDYKILLIRYKGKVHAVSAICTYDLETDLSEGICFNNKLYCPKHGCQYDITNGWVENPPAIDNLAIFSVNETPDFLRIFAPSVVPVKLKPAQAFRDYNDLRKVAIYGNGAAAYGCLAGLRENGYSGEISLITSDTHIPYDKLKLTKQIKATQPEDFYFRPEDQYDGVEFLLGKQIQYINNKHSNTYVELDDGTRVAYDALILCNGTFPVHEKISGIENQQNFYLNDLAQHQQLKERLKETKNLTVIGINLKSLETISTIRQEYPKININLIDINKVNYLSAVYGPQVSDKLLDMAIENGVQVFEKAQLRYFTDNQLEFYDGYKIQSDTVLMFPNNFAPDTEFTRRSRLFEYDTQGRISVDYNQRTLTKRIFAAGSVAQTLLPVTKQQHIGNQWTAAYNQGLTAAYNVLALNVPWHQVPFEYQELFGKVFQQVNTWTYYDTVHILGDLKKFDFVALYGANDYIIGAVGSQSNRMAVIAEALRVNRLPMLTDIVKNQVDFPKIDRAIRKYNKSACYRYPLYLHRDDYLEQDVIWSSREMFSTYINISDDPEIVPSDVSPNPNDVRQLD